MEKLLQEAEILIRNYSVFRGGSKWRSHREPSSPSDSLISTDGSYIKIYRESLSLMDYYPIQSLIKRLEIKRNISVFKEISTLWQQLNPSSLKSISKNTYSIIIELFYKQFQHSMANPNLIATYLAHDSEIDFKDKLGLTFLEFYDVIFEIVDALTKSALIGEYSRLIYLTTLALPQTPSFVSANLYTKIHMKEPGRPTHSPWMMKIIRDLTPERHRTQLPEIIKNPSSQNLAPKFLSRIKTRIVRNETPVKWSGIHRDINVSRRSKSPIRAITPKPEKKKAASFKRIEVRKDPLSILPRKDRKDTFLLEDIIEERTGKILRKHF